ncbi:MAG: class I SAM-dependent methyltransferase [Clostridiales bacterium]|nr:class I SAM-dependent methyltransferase [Clostridiales bacterium]
MKNYYGSLCTEMYEILHPNAPQDELKFYLSYAEKGMSILEPLCGSGRFLVPFWERGFNIRGIDLSTEMIAKLKEKAPDAIVLQGDILDYVSEEKYDYIFISSGSVSLFTDMELCKNILRKMKDLLRKDGKFVFAVDTVADRCPDDSEYKTSISVKTREGFDFILKGKNYYDEKTHTQFSPGIYELYDGTKLLQQEQMDFQTHLYELGEIEQYLQDIGFRKVNVYASYDKVIAVNNYADMFLYECSI